VARPPTIDRTTSGISFVDILFALAVGEVLAPLVPWAANHAKHALPAPIVWNLAVALVLILTSFIGYHNSQNRPLFTVRFVNVSLSKFALDILTVIVYFLFASYAAVSPAQTQTLLLLVVLVFGLYLLWDTASWYEKKRSIYRTAWTTAAADPDRPDVVDGAWTAFDYRRAVSTGVGLLAMGGLYAWSLQQRTPLPSHDVIAVNVLVIVVLLGYRIAKDNIPPRTPTAPEAPEAADLSAGSRDPSTSSTGTGTTTAPPPSEGSP
jgi:hypothetical protein